MKGGPFEDIKIFRKKVSQSRITEKKVGESLIVPKKWKGDPSGFRFQVRCFWMRSKLSTEYFW